MQCKKEEMKRDASMSEQEVTLFVDFYSKKKIKNKKIKNWESRMKSASSLHTVTQANKTC